MAADFYVSNSGDDWSSGSVDAPFLTIRRALDAAQPGDTITLRNGIYEGGFTIDKNNLTVRSAPGEWAVIESPLTLLEDGRANSVIRYNFDITAGRLENLEIAGGYYYVAPSVPQAADLRDIKIQVPLQVYSRDGRLLAEFGGETREEADGRARRMVEATLLRHVEATAARPAASEAIDLRSLIQDVTDALRAEIAMSDDLYALNAFS
mgnify:CR=1 FL=1